MKTRTTSFLLASLLGAAASTELQAQGTAFTYQGRLHDGPGPAHGSYDLRFIPFNASDGGSQAGSILTNRATVVRDGLFTVFLDFEDINFLGTNYWLEIAARTNGNGGFAWFQGGSHADDSYDPGPGGFRLMTLDGNGLIVNGTFASLSDRNARTGFAPVDPRGILEKLAALPITRWFYTNAPATAHLGPMAQDFHAAFHVGLDDKTIATVDAGGVALAAIQGLNQKLNDEVKRREAESAELKRELGELQQLVKSLKQQLKPGRP